MTTLLVLTTGQTDVQVVVDGIRYILNKKCCAALHDALERRTSDWRIVEAPNLKAEAPIEALPEGELCLCMPKLDALLREVMPTAALILETRRDAKSAPGDPRLAGAVLEARLKEQGVGTVQRLAYLTGMERLEDRTNPRDAVVRREVVQRLDRGVRRTIEAVAPSRIVVAATGGFPVVSHLVEEIVRLHDASGNVESFEIADGAQASPPTGDRAVCRLALADPVVSYQARRRALELIEGGNLLGAWAVVEPLHNDELESRWTRVVEWLACFAASLPIPEPESCDIPVLRHKCMAVRAALRVEFALLSNDIPRAIQGTVSFFEAALWDHLREKTLRHSDPTKRLFKFHEPPPDGLVRECDEAKLAALPKKQQKENGKRPFLLEEKADGSNWYRIYDSEICAIKIAKHYLKLDGLTKLAQALDSNIRGLRNDVAHSEPNPEWMGHARHQMREKLLWSSCDGFLSQPLAKDVLRELGESDPEKLCEDLLTTVRRRLVGVDQ